MPELNALLLNDVLAACEAGLEEASEALTRGLDARVTLSLGENAPVDRAALPPTWEEAGLAVVLQVGEQAAVVLIAESSGLLPDWYRVPDATGQSKLTTLAQELGMLLLPESHMPEQFQAGHVDRLSTAIQRGGLADDAVQVAFLVSHEDGRQGTLHLVWAVGKVDQILQAPASPEISESSAQADARDSVTSSGTSSTTGQANDESLSVDRLPSYSRSLLRIKVPVMVNLASKRQTVGRIVELESGSIIQFDKSCDELLELYLGNQKIAVGEAVKVGDKFGLRISSLVLPEERFRPVRTRQTG